MFKQHPNDLYVCALGINDFTMKTRNGSHLIITYPTSHLETIKRIGRFKRNIQIQNFKSNKPTYVSTCKNKTAPECHALLLQQQKNNNLRTPSRPWILTSIPWINSLIFQLLHVQNLLLLLRNIVVVQDHTSSVIRNHMMASMLAMSWNEHGHSLCSMQLIVFAINLPELNNDNVVWFNQR